MDQAWDCGKSNKKENQEWALKLKGSIRRKTDYSSKEMQSLQPLPNLQGHSATWLPGQSVMIWGKQFPLWESREVEHWGSSSCSIALPRTIPYFVRAVKLGNTEPQVQWVKTWRHSLCTLGTPAYGTRTLFCLGKAANVSHFWRFGTPVIWDSAWVKWY